MNTKIKYIYRRGWAFITGLYFDIDPHRHIFIIGHARTGSSAISSILASNSDMFGIGESWINWDKRRPFDLFSYRVYRVSRSLKKKLYSFDKINANELISAENYLLRDCKCIFLSRTPSTTIASIMNLYNKIGRTDLTVSDANKYYCERLRYMIEIWNKTPPHTRLHIDHREFLNPGSIVDRLNYFLMLPEALKTRYKVQSYTGKAGIGDPCGNARVGELLKRTDAQFEDLSTSDSQAAYNEFLEAVRCQG